MNLDAELLEEAAVRMPGQTRTDLLEEGLRALIGRDAAEALAISERPTSDSSGCSVSSGSRPATS